MDDLTVYLIAALVFSLGLHRLVATRRSRIAAPMRHAYRFASWLSVSLAACAPTTVGVLSHALPTQAGLPDLLGDLLRCCAACELGLLAVTLHPRRPRDRLRLAVRRHLSAVVAVAAAAIVLWLGARPRVAAETLIAAGPHRWFLAGYNACVTAYITCCVTVLAVRLTGHTRSTAPGPMRTALRLITWSSVVGVAWSAWGVDDVINAARTGRQLAAEDALSALLGACCVGLLVAGACSAGCGRARSGLAGWFAAYRRYRALTPLWSALHAVFPEIVLLPDARVFPPWDVRLALYRRVIEIHDARMLLARRLGSGGAEQVRRALHRPEPLAHGADATVEAAMLATALRLAETGSGPDSRADSGWQCSGALWGELDAEADWLGLVSHAFACSPDVARIRAHPDGPALGAGRGLPR